jgi:hypothetical protein
MHYTLRCKLDSGTPADVIEGAHVYVEMETLDDIGPTLDTIGAAYTEALDEGISTAFLDEAAMRHLYPDGEPRPGDDPAPQVTEALHNLAMVENRLRSWADDARHRELGGGQPASEELDGALADLHQAQRFLRGEETPA